MGLLDFITGGTPAQKAQKLKAKVTQKYGDPTTRQKAISQLGELRTPEAAAVLLHRFTITVDPHTTDEDEKNHVFDLLTSQRQDVVPAVKEFLVRSDHASSWALRVLGAVLPEAEVIGIACENLTRMGAEYTRDPEKKQVLLQFLQGKDDPRIGPTALPFLQDMSDDIKLAALATLASQKYEPAREPILELLTADETAKRLQGACVQALAECGFTVQGYREKVEARLSDPWFVDKAGAVKKRGE